MTYRILITLIYSLPFIAVFPQQRDTDAVYVDEDSTQFIVYENISELRKSFEYPTFNGSYRPIQLMTTAAVTKAFQYEPGLNVRPIGTTLINVIIDKEGKVREPKLIESVWATADSQILDLLRRFPTMTPGKLNGKPVDTKIIISIEWDLSRAYFTYLPYSLNQ